MASAPPLPKKLFCRAPGVISASFSASAPDGLDVVDVGAGVHELLGLGHGGLEDLLVVVPGVGHADAGEAVDVLGAVGVVEQGSVAVVGDHRLDALHEPGHDVVAVLFLHTHGIDPPSAHTGATVDNEKRGVREAYQMRSDRGAGGAACPLIGSDPSAPRLKRGVLPRCQGRR